MATAASSPLASSVEKTNGAKLSRLLIDGGTTVLRKVFDGRHPPANLTADLNANKTILSNLLKKKVLHKPQWDKLFPPGGAAPDSNTFDITLLFLLLSNISGLTPPPSGWHTKPPPSDTSYEANLARVKFYRNVLYGHVTTTGVDTPTFSALWTEISGVLVSLGLNQAEVDRLKAEKGGELDYIGVLIEWADGEEDIKSQLKNMHQTQTKTLQAVEDVHQTQTKTLKKVDDISQTQSKTQQSMEEFRQTIEQVRSENAKNVEEVAAGLQEIKDKVDSLTEGNDKDMGDMVLRNLAKSEFKGDIEYYVNRYQAGTREWIFDRVQHWLDDKSSENRVMVITGKAGMGKSVIAAVICKRMQEAGRLSGSHFCQYNNVRYCKPQLMLQSLACHLSHAVPEYKQALVQQLSRNLGTDLNNMGTEELFALLFKEPLGAVSRPERNMLMVIDGLDESEYQGRNELLDVIANQFCKLPVWIRFLVSTRPALNITGKLKHLKPFELKSNDEKNLEDIRVFFLQRLGHLVNVENIPEFVESLVLKSDGLMLYAYFLILSIAQNTSAVQERDLDDSLPSGISSVYISYFKRLERELLKELDIKEEHFLNMLSAITASREPLPVGFVSKLLVSSSNSPLTKRKVLRVLGSVSALLPVRDDCVHVIHKSVKDWLTDTSCYGEHEFIMDENEGHRILAALCTDELEDLKQKGVHKVEFSATQRYALYHGRHHILHEGVKREPHKLDELTKAYIIDLQIVYAKTCVNSTLAAEDLLWLKKQEMFTMLSNDNQSTLDTLSFLLRKYLPRFRNTPRMFLPTILNKGGKVLSVEASSLLQNRYPEIPYMEDVRKETKQGGVVARFECSSFVVCVDVSPQLDYMVCECNDGKLQLWSLHTGRLLWIRPVMIKKCNVTVQLEVAYRNVLSAKCLSSFRSVIFHPTKELVLPGILSQAYTFDGDLEPLFPESNCRFSVCSVSGDKTKILTNCLENSKHLVCCSLQNGGVIRRFLLLRDIVSFAWSGDGRLLAVSDSSGFSLFDVTHGLGNLVRKSYPKVFGMLKFSPDHQSLFCCHLDHDWVDTRFFRFSTSLNKETKDTFAITFASHNYDIQKFQGCNDSGFKYGDPIGSRDFSGTYFVCFLDEQRLLQFREKEIEMVYTTNVNESGQDWRTRPRKIALSLDWQTVYVGSCSSVTAWDVLSGKFIKDKITSLLLSLERLAEIRDSLQICLCPLREGVLISLNESTVELWAHDLSECIRKWTNLPRIRQMIAISDERVAVVRESEVQVLDTSSGESVSTIPVFPSVHPVSHGRIFTCNSKFQVVTDSDPPYSLKLIDDSTVVWKKDHNERFLPRGATFSPTEQFLITWSNAEVLVLDAKTGHTSSNFSLFRLFNSYSTIIAIDVTSDEEILISYDSSVLLFNVKSSEVISVIDVEGQVTCLAACPSYRVLAVGLMNSTPNFKVIRVHLPRDADSGNGKRPCRATLRELTGYDSPHKMARGLKFS